MGRDVRQMRAPVVALAFALASTGCKLKVEASVTGPAGGAGDAVRVRVVGPSGAELTCSDGACEQTKVPYSGQTDINVKVPPGDPKTVDIKVKKGIRTGSVTLDLGAGGAGSTLTVRRGQIACLPTGCKVRIDIAPRPRLSLEAPPGSTIDVGGETLTVPVSGKLAAPLKLAVSPAIQEMSLDKICSGVADPKEPTVLASTTITVTLPGRAPMSTAAELDLALAEQGLSLALFDMKKGPVVFPWEKPGQASKGKRAGVYSTGRVCHDAGATGATVADLDVVALAVPETREDECVYKLTNGETARGALTLYDQKATVYDRATGAVLSTKTFLAPKKCNAAITVRGESTSTTRQTSFVSDSDIATWAATFAK
jgi:hypothetical protein